MAPKKEKINPPVKSDLIPELPQTRVKKPKKDSISAAIAKAKSKSDLLSYFGKVKTL